MKTVLALAAFAVALQASDAKITATERAHAIQLLEDSQKEFLSYIEGLTEEQWTWKSAPDRWSVGQTAEHIVLAEGALFSMMQKALDTPPNPDWDAKTSKKTAFLEKVMVDRSNKAQAPESIVPQGKLSRDETIRLYKEARGKTLAFIQNTEIPLKEHTFDHPFPVFSTLNAYQWLIYIPLHNMRHDQQIAEVKATAGYPK